jgi:hypothetical protein
LYIRRESLRNVDRSLKLLELFFPKRYTN